MKLAPVGEPLARSSFGGERENAEVLLVKLLLKHSMTLADFEEVLDEPRAVAWLAATNADERTVLSQLLLQARPLCPTFW